MKYSEEDVQKIVEVQQLDHAIDRDRKVRDSFMVKKDFELANEMQNEITANQIKRDKLYEKLDESEKEIYHSGTLKLRFSNDGIDSWREII